MGLWKVQSGLGAGWFRVCSLNHNGTSNWGELGEEESIGALCMGLS
jgi:hypothetical protein